MQPGVHAGLSSRRSRVQIPSGPLPLCERRVVRVPDALRVGVRCDGVSCGNMERSWQQGERSGSSVGRARAEKREVTGSMPVPTTNNSLVRALQLTSLRRRSRRRATHVPQLEESRRSARVNDGFQRPVVATD